MKSHRKKSNGLLSGMWGWQDVYIYDILKNDGTVLEDQMFCAENQGQS